MTSLCFVVPSRRSGLFLSRAIAKRIEKPIFQPEIFSIEDFIELESGVKIQSNLDILPRFYATYRELNGDKADSYDRFLNWAPAILQDFNEIDRQLIDSDNFFDYWRSIREMDETIKHWSDEENQTQLITDYLKFWDKLRTLYNRFRLDCSEEKIGYSGLAYKLASEKIKSQKVRPNKTIFLGFNALTNAETSIIQHLLQGKNAKVFWDTDKFFLDKDYHEAAKYIRKYNKTWDYYSKEPLLFVGHTYAQKKHIQLHGTSGSINMLHIAANLLRDIPKDDIEQTAVVLANENLLLPLLKVIPDSITQVNITLSLSLDKLPIASFFRNLIRLYLTEPEKEFYHIDLLKVLESPFATYLFGDSVHRLSDNIKRENLIYVQQKIIKEYLGTNDYLLLENDSKTAHQTLQKLFRCIEIMKKSFLNSENVQLQFEQLLGVSEIMEKVWQMLETIPQQESRVILQLYNQFLPIQKLSFIGEPVQGLQIMGILETRALDFKNVIIISVNEGILPAGKSNSSFIPFDLRMKFQLPTYRDRDSIYAYHFYRLLQRVKKAHLIYNTDQQALGSSEKSRFLTQIESTHDTEHLIENFTYVIPQKVDTRDLLELPKSTVYLERLDQIAKSGFSPSALTSYIRNPLDFCTSYIFQIKDTDDVEEEMALNTMGNIIHDCLENIYKPLNNKILIGSDLKDLFSKIESQLTKSFLKAFPYEKVPTGRNKVIYEVSRHYLNKMIDMDLALVQQGNELEIIDLEVNLEGSVNISNLGAVKLKGTIDRVDRLNGNIRIIDYKTGKVDKKHVGIEPDGYDDLSSHYEKSKAFQVLMYAYLYHQNYPSKSVEHAGIISFKNFGAGFMPFSLRSGRSFKPEPITREVLDAFEAQLTRIILELYDLEIPIQEKEV